MKIVIFTRESPSNIYLVKNIVDNLRNVDAIIIESHIKGQFRSLKSKLKRYRKQRGIWYSLYKLFEAIYIKFENIRLDRQILLFGAADTIQFPHSVPSYKVDNINDKFVYDKVMELAPDLIVVLGTSIIKPPLIKVPAKGMINLHMGITPEYRGSKGEFWALYNNEPDKVGVTVHYIDEGIDTGNIILQGTVEVTSLDNERTLRCKNIKKGAELLIQSIHQIGNGTTKIIQRENEKTAFYSTPSLLDYIQLHRRLKKLRKSVETSKGIDQQR